jgi:site-specific recombinase XerC
VQYLQCKGLTPKPRHRKSTEAAITEPEWRSMLDAAEASKDQFNKHHKRDHACLYLGYMFALRLNEACILERNHFRNLEADDTVNLPTVEKPEGQDFPIIEEAVSAYILDYIEKQMRPDQRWLFESKPGHHVSQSYLSRIFNTYAKQIGLNSNYAWQSLRHGRGFRLWAVCHDLTMVSQGLRCNLHTAQKYASLDPENEKEFKKTLSRIAFNPLKHRKVGQKK